MAYRKAKSIELHEANTIITLSTEGYASTAPAGRHVRANRAAFSLRLADIARLAERLGIHPQEQSRRLENLPNESLSILREYYEVPAGAQGATITGLECEVIEANLVDIRITIGQDGKTSSAVETITHSGSFTIWWAEEQPNIAEQLFAAAEAHPTIPLEAEVPPSIEDQESDVGIIPPKLDEGPLMNQQD